MADDPKNVPPVTPNEPTPDPVVEDPKDPANPDPDPVDPNPDADELTPEEVAQLRETNKKLYERAKKAEADLRAAKAPKPKAPADPKTPASSQPSVEETVLLANGMDETLLGELKAVAAARGIGSLIKAQNDPIFVAVKEKFEKDKKVRDSSLPPSRGASSAKAKKTFETPGLSREDHKRMALEEMHDA